MAFGKLGASFGRLGAQGGHGVTAPPSTPVLAVVAPPPASQNSPQFTIDTDPLAAGDIIRLQIATSGTSFGSIISDTSHTVTSGEAAALQVDLSILPRLANATYDARALHHRLADSAWSNTVTFTVLNTNALVNTTAPVISGDPSNAGNVLTTTDGVWTGEYPITPAYQWKRGVTNIGTNSNSYTLVLADTGASITCVVTETNAQGSVSATSNAVTAGVAPANTAAPVLSGDPSTIGNVLSVTAGTWSGATPQTPTYQWTRDGVNIPGANASTYTLVTADNTHTILCVVTETNSWGNASANSNSVVGGATLPVNTAAPAVTGTTSIDFVLTCSTGTWTGTPTITFAFQWRRNGSNIVGQTSSTYTQVSADSGNTIDCVVTASNVAGNTAHASNAVTSRAAATLNWVSSKVVTTNGNPVIATSTTIGNATSDAYQSTRRLIIVCHGWAAGHTVTSIDVNGTATLTQDLQVNSGSTTNQIAVFSGLVDNTYADSATINIHMSASEFSMGFFEVYTIDNSLLVSTTPATGSNTGAAVTSLSATIASVTARSAILAMVQGNTGGMLPVSWTGSTNSPNSEGNGGGSGVWTVGHFNNATGAAPWTGSASLSSSQAAVAMGLLAYR